MSTQLAKQLKALQQKDIQVGGMQGQGGRKAKGVVSLWWHGREAADKGADEVWALAMSGLKVLEAEAEAEAERIRSGGDTTGSAAHAPSADETLHRRRAETRANETLKKAKQWKRSSAVFSTKLKAIARAHATEKENQRIDAAVKAYLRWLSPHLLKPAAQKTFEWLLRHFRVHEFNVDDVLACILPYHETEVFVRILSVLHVEVNVHWGWLTTAKKRAVPLTRSFLVQRCLTDGRFMSWVLSSASAAFEEKASCHTDSPWSAFMVALGVAVMDAGGCREEASISRWMPFLVHGMKAASRGETEHAMTAYLLLSHMVLYSRFKANVLKDLLSLLATHCYPSNATTVSDTDDDDDNDMEVDVKATEMDAEALCLVQAALQCILRLLSIHDTHLDSLPSAVVDLLLRLPESVVQALFERFGVLGHTFLRLALHALVPRLGLKDVLACRLYTQLVHMTTCDVAPLAPGTLAPLLTRLLRHLVAVVAATGADHVTDASLHAAFWGLMDTVARCDPRSLETALAQVTDASTSSTANGSWALDRVLALWTGGPFTLIPRDMDDAGCLSHGLPPLPLYLALQYPSETVRLRALHALLDLLPSTQDAEAADIDTSTLCRGDRLLALLRDDADDIVRAFLAALPQRPTLLARLPASSAVPALCDLIRSTRRAADVRHTAMRVLVATYPNALQGPVLACVVHCCVPSRDVDADLQRHAVQALSDAAHALPPLTDEATDARPVSLVRLFHGVAALTVSDGVRFEDAMLRAMADALAMQPSEATRRALLHDLFQYLLAAPADANGAMVFAVCLLNRLLFVMDPTPARRRLAARLLCDLPVSVQSAGLVTVPCASGMVPGLLSGDDGHAPSTVWAKLRYLTYHTLLTTVLHDVPVEGEEAAEFMDDLVMPLLVRLLSQRTLDDAVTTLLPRWLAAPWVAPRALLLLTGMVYRAALLPDGVLLHSLQLVHCLLSAEAAVPSADATPRKGKGRGKTRVAAQHTCTDYQALLPSLMVALQHPSQAVRAVVLDCFEDMQRLYAHNADGTVSMHVYQKDRLETADKTALFTIHELRLLMARAVARRREYLADAGFVAGSWLADLKTDQGSVSRRHVWHVLARAMDRMPSVAARRGILSILSVAHQKTRPELLRALAPSLHDLHQHGRALCDEDPIEFKAYVADICRHIVQRNSTVVEEEALFDAITTILRAPCSDAETSSTMSPHAKVLFQGVLTSMSNEGVFSGISSDAQRTLFRCFLDASTHPRAAPAWKDTIKEVVMAIPMDYSLFYASMKEACKACQGSATTTAKRSRTDSKEELHKHKQEALETISVLLEWIQCKEETIMTPSALIPILFDVLGLVQELEVADEMASLEYSKQMTILILTRIFESGFEVKTTSEADVRVDLLVQTLRLCINSQTQNQILLLLASIAPVFPDRVLHNIMPIFTFMGTNVLRQDDNYSFQVIKSTIEKVVPALVHRAKVESTAAFRMGCKPVMQVFAESLQHIPTHRRLGLFQTLVETLGEEDFLSSVTLLILQKTALKSRAKETDAMHAFCAELFGQFGIPVQLQALFQMLTEIATLPFGVPSKDDITAGKAAPDGFFFDLKLASTKQLLQYKVTVTAFTKHLMGHASFHRSIAALPHGQEGVIERLLEPHYHNILENLLHLIDQCDSKQQDQHALPVTMKALNAVALEALDKVNMLLSLPSFVGVVGKLLKTSNAMLRRRSLMLFNDRVSNLKGSLKNRYVDRFLAMVPELATMICERQQEDGGKGGSEADAVNRQTALLSLEILARNFSNQHAKPFVKILPILLGEEALGHANIHVVASTLLCLTSFIVELGPRLVGIVNLLVPKIVDIGTEAFSKKSEGQDVAVSRVLQTSVLAALEVSSQKMAPFLAPYLKRIFDLLFQTSALFDRSSSTSNHAQQKLIEKVENIENALASKVEPRVLFPVFFKYHKDTLANGSIPKEAFIGIHNFMDKCLNAMDKSLVCGYHSYLSEYFIDALNVGFSIRQRTYVSEDFALVQESVIQTFTTFVLKINETIFKPLFANAFQWCQSQDKLEDKERHHRIMAFYRLARGLSVTLKSIFNPYLKTTLLFAAERLETMTMVAEEKASILNETALLMHVFHLSMLHDTEGLYAKEFCEQVAPALVHVIDLIGHQVSHESLTTVSTSESTLFANVQVSDLVRPWLACMGQICVTSRNDAVWKTLNHQVLMKTRSETPAVRRLAMKAVEECYNRLGEEFLILLPETIPFLAELLEDDDERVEKECLSVVKTIEGYLGESLQQYFK